MVNLSGVFTHNFQKEVFSTNSVKTNSKEYFYLFIYVMEALLFGDRQSWQSHFTIYEGFYGNSFIAHCRVVYVD